MFNKLVKIAMVVLPILVLIFIFIWAGKSKQPINNTITTAYNIELSSQDMWWSNTEEDTSVKEVLPDGYTKVPGTDNLYMVLDNNNKVKEYVLRKYNNDGSSTWEIFNKNISSIMTHVEGNIYKYKDGDKIMYFKYTEKENGEYTLDYVEDYEESTENTVKEEVIRETKYEDGFVVVYETIIYKTYNSSGELINTRTEGPNVVSKTKEDKETDKNKEWLNGMYAKLSGKYDYRDSISNILMGLLNTKRKELGATAYTTSDSSTETLLAKTCAADLLNNGFDYNSDFFKEVENRYPYYNIISLTVPHSVGKSDKEVAEFVQSQFNGNEDACKIRYSTNYTDAAVCIINTDEGYLIVEIYNKNN